MQSGVCVCVCVCGYRVFKISIAPLVPTDGTEGNPATWLVI